VIEAAWRRGARFDGWGEQFDWQRWVDAFSDAGLDPDFYARARNVDEVLPWDVIDADITKKFLLRERRKAFEERLTNDCRWGDCHMCGIPNAPADIKLAVDRPEALGVAGRIGLDGNLIPKAGFARKIAIQPAAAPYAPELSSHTPAVPEDPAPSAPVSETRFTERVFYSTSDEVRYLAHADLMRAFHRAFRVGRLPVVMSQGFTPRPRAAFGPPLPLGVTGAREAMDLGLTLPFTGEHLAALNAALPLGIRVLDHAPTPDGPSLAAAVNAADYRVRLPARVSTEEIAVRVRTFAAAIEYPVTKARHGRPDRQVDLKQAILEVEIASDHTLTFRLAMNAEQQVSASLVLATLCGLGSEEVAASRIERLRLHTPAGAL
jgi:radical SAM-linked protein